MTKRKNIKKRTLKLSQEGKIPIKRGDMIKFEEGGKTKKARVKGRSRWKKQVKEKAMTSMQQDQRRKRKEESR